MEPEVGNILEGKVTTITKFGAFVSLEGGKSGLVHISEIANTFVNDVHDFLQEGQAVKVLVLSTENGKINLSIKRTIPREERPAQPRQPRFAQRDSGAAPRPFGGARPQRPAQPRNFSRGPVQPQNTGDLSFEDKLKQFMTSSEGKMADLNRNIDGKRSGGRRRK
jgi:S1 RNA binding domain protein